MVLAQLLERLRGVDELYLALAALFLLVGDDPHVGGDARVVEDVVRQLDDGLDEVVLEKVAARVRLAAPGVAGEECRAVVNRRDARALRLGFERRHLREHFEDEQELSVGGARGGVHILFLAREVDELHAEAVVEQFRVVVDELLVLLPALSVGRIRDHVAEALLGETVVGEHALELGDRVAVADVLGVGSLDDEVGLADGVGFGVHLRAGEEDGGGVHAQRLNEIALRFGQHAARAAGGVVEGERLREIVLGRLEDEAREQHNGVARGEVFTGLLVVLFVEATEQFLEHLAHADVVQGRDDESVRPLHGLVGEVDARVGDMLDDGKETVVVGELLRLLRRGASVLGEEAEFLEDVPHVVREAQKVLVEVGEQDALVVGGLGLEIVQRPLARVVVREARDVHEHVGVDAVLLHLGVDLRLRRLQ